MAVNVASHWVLRWSNAVRMQPYHAIEQLSRDTPVRRVSDGGVPMRFGSNGLKEFRRNLNLVDITR